MARRLLVEIIGDASGLERSMGRAEAATGRFGGAMGKLGAVAKVAGLAIVGGVAVGLEQSVKAALEAQASQARLDQSFKNVGLSAAKYAGTITRTEQAGEKLGFVSSDIRNALGSLITATGSVQKSTADMAVAQDIARFKGVGLVDASKMLTMAMTGSQRAAKQLGITVIPLTSNLDALKRSHVDLTTAAGKAAEAHAKLQDKMATGQAVIAAVTAKIHGQAQAFSETAAGGMARFHAAVVDLEEKVGTALLPALTKVADALARFVSFLSTSPGVAKAASAAMAVFGDVMHTLTAAGELLLGWYQRHQTAAKAIIAVLAGVALALSGPIVIIGALGVALIELYKRSQTFRDAVNQAFQAVQAKVQQVMPTIKAIISGVVTTVEALWRTFGGTLISVATTASRAVIRVIQDIASVVGSVFTLIGDLIHGRWGKVWGDLTSIVSHAFDAVKTILVTEATIVLNLALAIGKAILEGILHGVEGLGSSLAGKLKSEVGGAVSSVKGFLHIGSPSRLTADEIGGPMGEGVIMGWLLSSAALPAKMAQSLQNAINAGRAVIQAAQATFQSAFSSLTSIADNAFSAIAGAAQTKSEKAIAKLQAAHDKAQQLADLAAANQAVGDAKSAAAGFHTQEGEDPQAALARQQALTQAVTDAEKARDELLYQQHIAALQKKAAAERKNLDAQNAVKQLNFDKELAALEKHLEKTGATAAQSQEAILKLFAKYGIKFAAVGRDMGIAWVDALKRAIAEAAGDSGAIGAAIAAIASGIKVPKGAGKAAGGPVSGGTAYTVGERGPELFVPGTSGTIIPNGAGGSGVFELHSHIYLDGVQITKTVQRELIRMGRSSSGGVLGGLA